MKKWWRRFKHKRGWDFHKKQVGTFFYRGKDERTVHDTNGCYSYTCDYCGMSLWFPWRETVLAFYNMKRHLEAKHDVL